VTQRRLNRGVVLLAALGMVLVLTALPGVPASVAAADDGIDVGTASTYTLLPDEQIVRVVVDITATNSTPPTTAGGIIRRYFFETLHVAVQPEAVAIRATSGGQRLTTRATNRKGFRQVALTLRPRLFYQQTARIRLTYELPGGAPRSDSDVRVGKAFASFYAWANGDRASVRISLPGDYEPTIGGAELRQRRTGGRIVYSADGITDTSGWYATVDAERPSALGAHWLSVPTGESVSVRAWPEDPEWQDRVSDRLERGLPELDGLIGLPWPVTGALVVTEVHTPLLEGYSGIYHPDTDGIEISEDLDDLTILHEASHAWFNGNLFAGRWINEGLADTYATKALGRIGIFSRPPDPHDRSEPGAFALNDWPPLGRIDDDVARAREAYGYDTSFRVIQQISTVAGDAAMRNVLAAAANAEIAYVGAGPVEHLSGVPDWRALLDYLDERAGSTNATSLFRLYVAAPSEISQLAARDKARAAYAELVRDGRGWLPAYAIRSPLAGWEFPAANAAMETAQSILDLRDEIAVAGAPIGLVAPDALRLDYETAESDLSAVLSDAQADLAAATAIVAAAEKIAAPRDIVTEIGLGGFEPATVLEAAKEAYRADRVAAARDSVGVAVDALDRAPTAGFQTVSGVAFGSVVIGLFVALVVVQRRRSRRRSDVPAAQGAVWGPGVFPTATLPSQSSPEPPGPEGALEPIVQEPIDNPPAGRSG